MRNKKTTALWLAAAAVIFCLAVGFYVFHPSEDEPCSAFQALVCEINGDTLLVEPLPHTAERSSSDRISLPLTHMTSSPEPEFGDLVKIEYDGIIQEIYPATLHKIYSVKVIDDSPTICYFDQVYQKKDLSPDTLSWLYMFNQLSETDQLSLDYVPSELTTAIAPGEVQVMETDEAGAED